MDRIGRKQQGLPYYYDDPAILGDQHQYQEKLAQYNRISPMEPERRAAMLPQLRKNHYVYNLPVCIGDNVWIGSGAQILPGVTIGENSVIGAGSVVTHDIPANVAAYGVPCKVIREIGEQDRRYYDKDWKLDVWE